MYKEGTTKHKMKSKLLVSGISAFLVFGVIFIIGCIQQAPQENLINANLDTEFKLKINETGFIETENIKVKFLDVTEDSRCASDVVCVWEGQAKIVVNILKNDKNLGNFTLTVGGGHEDSAVITFNGYFVKLIKVDPYPKSTQEIDISDYVITLIVSKI